MWTCNTLISDGPGGITGPEIISYMPAQADPRCESAPKDKLADKYRRIMRRGLHGNVVISQITSQDIRVPIADSLSMANLTSLGDEHGIDAPPQREALQACGYEPKTELGRKLLAIRRRAIDNGVTLLSPDEVAAEVQNRRTGRGE